MAIGVCDAVPERARAVPHVRPAGRHRHRRASAASGPSRSSSAPCALADGRPRSGPRTIVGMEGVVDTGGYVIVHGERWRAESDSDARARAARRGRRASTGCAVHVEAPFEARVPVWQLSGIVVVVVLFLAVIVPDRGGPDPARVPALHRLPARPALPRAEGPGPLLPDPVRRPGDLRRPAHDHAEHPAAGSDHEGQRRRCA